jgi:dipicolinate synthase subunit A
MLREAIRLKKLSFSIYGSDARQRNLAALLEKDGHILTESGEVCILPIPSPALPPSDENHRVIIGGKLSGEFIDRCRQRGAAVGDVTVREDFAAANAAICAEGAVMLAMENTLRTVAGAEVLVIGYGRIGRLLCARLRALGARVTAAARKASDRAWIRAEGHLCADTAELPEAVKGKSIVFNTVPARLTDACVFEPGCLFMELATLPPGDGTDAASHPGLRLCDGRGLPARTAPVSAAEALKDTVYNILREEKMI